MGIRDDRTTEAGAVNGESFSSGRADAAAPTESWIWLFMVIVAIATIDTLVYFFASQGLGQTIGIGDAILKKVPGWCIGALSLPLLIRAARRYVYKRGARWRTLLGSLTLLLGLTVGMMTVGVVLIRLARGKSLTLEVAQELILQEFAKNFFFAFFVFCAFFFLIILHVQHRAPMDRKLLPMSGAEPDEARQFIVRERDGVRLVPLADIEYFEAAGNYVTIHTRDGNLLVRETMGGIEKRLHGRPFVRAHRRAIVNIDSIAEVATLRDGRGEVVLRSGARLDASRAGRERLQTYLAASSAPVV